MEGMGSRGFVMAAPWLSVKKNMEILAAFFYWLVVFNHLEKYEFVNGKDDIPYIMENNPKV